jgi:cardiolipin synthase
MRALFRRRVFIIIILLIQIAFIISFVIGSNIVSRYVGLALTFLSIVVCLSIINKRDKPAYKVTWIFLILVFPFFGGILYIIFQTQANSKKNRIVSLKSKKEFEPFFFLKEDAFPALSESDNVHLPQIRYLRDYAGFPIFAHTQTLYFNSGESFFSKLLEELEKAERYIFIEFFILRQGVMLDPVIALLEKKVKAGLDVRIIYDDVGCFLSLPSDYKQNLEMKGIKCIVYNPFKPILSSHQNNRDHRKIIVIDGKTAFTGGVNLADEYINQFERFGHWKDAAIMLKGEAAWSFAVIFLQMWHLKREVSEDVAAFYPWQDAPCPIESDGYIQPYADNPFDGEHVGEHVYIQIINNAKKYVYINTPYLVVGDNILSALTLAAKSGIDVRIITPHHWDKKTVAITSRSYYRSLISAGIKIYEYTKGFNHSKTFVSDDKIATVGTANLDFRSLYLHFECGVCIYENTGVEAIKRDFLETLAVSHSVTLKECGRNAFRRIVQDVLRVFAPFM